MIYKIIKLGKVKNPHSKHSDYGESMSYHLGFFIEGPKLAERFNLLPLSNHNGERGISTSPVTKIIDESTFETLNSIYKIEKQ